MIAKTFLVICFLSVPSHRMNLDHHTLSLFVHHQAHFGNVDLPRPFGCVRVLLLHFTSLREDDRPIPHHHPTTHTHNPHPPSVPSSSARLTHTNHGRTRKTYTRTNRHAHISRIPSETRNTVVHYDVHTTCNTTSLKQQTSARTVVATNGTGNHTVSKRKRYR